ncbi:MAG: hypothetical protein PHT58_07850 [Eubacteriales bacterium]|nr:hypothetical protein [Eubacteriales bacterium]
MRKQYQKPWAYTETLTVNTRINSSCGGEVVRGLGAPLYATSAACAQDAGEATVFGPSTVMGCQIVTDEYNGVCYSTPNGGIQAFTS